MSSGTGSPLRMFERSVLTWRWSQIPSPIFLRTRAFGCRMKSLLTIAWRVLRTEGCNFSFVLVEANFGLYCLDHNVYTPFGLYCLKQTISMKAPKSSSSSR
ncbi:unnamed protein product [Musa hybrid cultivar]